MISFVHLIRSVYVLVRSTTSFVYPAVFVCALHDLVCLFVCSTIYCLFGCAFQEFVCSSVRSFVCSLHDFVRAFVPWCTPVHCFARGLFLVSCVSCIASWRGCVFGLTFFVFRCFSCDAVTAACVNCSRDASRPSVLLVEQPKNACAMTSPSRSVGRCSALRAA